MKIKRICLWITFLIILVMPCFVLAYGGGSYAVTVPEVNANSLSINNGASTTTLNIVNLQLLTSNAYQMAISNTPDFLNVAWETYNPAKAWTLTTGEGTKTIYVKFRSSNGGVSQVISKTITLQSPTLLNQPDINGDNKINDFDFSILMSNWGTPKNTAADLNKDGSVNDFDFSILMSKWTR